MAAALAGALGVFCSVMVYVATGRAQWSATPTGIKFFGTALVLGASSVLAVGLFSSAPGAGIDHVAEALLGLVLAASGIKLALDASLLGHARDRQLSTEKRVARVMLGDLRAVTGLRLGLVLARRDRFCPALLLRHLPRRAAAHAVLCMVVLLLGGEIAERVLFFRRRRRRACRAGCDDQAVRTPRQGVARAAGAARRAAHARAAARAAQFGLGQLPKRLAPTRPRPWSAASAPPAAA